jgi:hypothetical protein
MSDKLVKGGKKKAKKGGQSKSGKSRMPNLSAGTRAASSGPREAVGEQETITMASKITRPNAADRAAPEPSAKNKKRDPRRLWEHKVSK